MIFNFHEWFYQNFYTKLITFSIRFWIASAEANLCYWCTTTTYSINTNQYHLFRSMRAIANTHALFANTLYWIVWRRRKKAECWKPFSAVQQTITIEIEMEQMIEMNDWEKKVLISSGCVLFISFLIVIFLGSAFDFLKIKYAFFSQAFKRRNK